MSKLEFTAKHLQEMQQIKRAIQLTAAALPHAQAREVAMVYEAYQTGKAYAAGDYFTDGADANGDPILYSVVQDHTSAAEWPPASTPSLYTPITLTESGRPIWAPPTGAHDAYNKGDVVSHEGRLWKSKRDGNTSEPGTDEWWELYEEV